MYLKIPIDQMKIELSDILEYFESTYHLNDCRYWEERSDGRIYVEVREHVEEQVHLSDTQLKAYKIWKSVYELSRMESSK